MDSCLEESIRLQGPARYPNKIPLIEPGGDKSQANVSGN